jgi:PAS domain S-box-containing protein
MSTTRLGIRRTPSGPGVQNEELLRFQASVLSQVTDAVFGVDPEYRLVYWNKAAENLCGLSASEVLGHPIQEVVRYRWINPDDEASCRSALKDSGFWHEEIIHLKRTGEEIYVDGSVTRVDVAGVLYLAVNRDVAQRRRAEIALRQPREELEARKHAEEALRESEALQQLSGRLLSLQDEERRRLARELHDSTPQTLSALSLSLTLLEQTARPTLDERSARTLADSIALASEA